MQTPGYPKVIGNAENKVPIQMEMDDENVVNGPFYDVEVRMALTGRWSDGLFGCFSDYSTCCIGCFASFYLVYLIMSRLPPKYRKIASVCGSDPCQAAACYLCCGAIVPYLSLIMLCSLHDALAARYKIKDSGICCQAFCCHCCVLTRLIRHLNRAQGFTQYHGSVRRATEV